MVGGSTWFMSISVPNICITGTFCSCSCCVTALKQWETLYLVHVAHPCCCVLKILFIAVVRLYATNCNAFSP